GKIHNLSKGQGSTVLFVSHNMSSIKQLCSRLLVLENGISLFDGGVNEGIDFYIASGTRKLKEKSLHINNTNSIKILKNRIKVAGKQIKFNQSILLGDKLDIFLKLGLNDSILDLSIAFDIINVNMELIAHITNED